MIVLGHHIFRVFTFTFCRRIVIIEIAGVGCVLDLWYDWTLDLALIQGFPVNALEKLVRFHQGDAALATFRDVAQSL